MGCVESSNLEVPDFATRTQNFTQNLYSVLARRLETFALQGLDRQEAVSVERGAKPLSVNSCTAMVEGDDSPVPC